MSVFPAEVQFDLQDHNFRQQLVKLKTDHPHLFAELHLQFSQCTGMPWSEFETIATPKVTEQSFIGSYIILRLHMAEGEVHIYTHLADEVLVPVRIHKPYLED